MALPSAVSFTLEKIEKGYALPEEEQGLDFKQFALGMRLLEEAAPVLASVKEPKEGPLTQQEAKALQQLVRSALLLSKFYMSMHIATRIGLEHLCAPLFTRLPAPTKGANAKADMRLELLNDELTPELFLKGAAVLVVLAAEHLSARATFSLAEGLLMHLDMWEEAGMARELEQELQQLAGEEEAAGEAPLEGSSSGSAQQDPEAAEARWLARSPTLSVEQLRLFYLLSRQRAVGMLVQHGRVQGEERNALSQQAEADCRALIAGAGGRNPMLRDFLIGMLNQDDSRLAEVVAETERGLADCEATKSWYSGAHYCYNLASGIAGGTHGGRNSRFHVPGVRAMMSRGKEFEQRCAVWLTPTLKDEVAGERRLAQQILKAALDEHEERKVLGRRLGIQAQDSDEWVLPSRRVCCSGDIGTATLDIRGEGSQCHSCGRASMHLKSCGGCGVARYCSRACQAAHWREGGHKEQCAQLAAASGRRGGRAGR